MFKHLFIVIVFIDALISEFDKSIGVKFSADNSYLAIVRKHIFITVIALCLISCGKDPVQEEASSMIGTWVHYTSTEAWEKIIINEDGTGKVEWYTNSKLHQETKEKSWFVKDNRLYLGKATFSINPYDIDTYPLTSGATEIQGYDTLVQGVRYCILDDLTFVEKG